MKNPHLLVCSILICYYIVWSILEQDLKWSWDVVVVFCDKNVFSCQKIFHPTGCLWEEQNGAAYISAPPNHWSPSFDSVCLRPSLKLVLYNTIYTLVWKGFLNSINLFGKVCFGFFLFGDTSTTIYELRKKSWVNSYYYFSVKPTSCSEHELPSNVPILLSVLQSIPS